MSYVKTKDAIYECHADASLEEINNAYADDVVIAKADTIEELCDCYAFEDCLDPAGGLLVFKSFTFAKLQAKKMNQKLFGYIIIEKKDAKALEPVAVLNEKGEMQFI